MTESNWRVLPLDGTMLWQMLRHWREDLDGRERERLASTLAGVVNGFAPPSPSMSSPPLDAVVRTMAEEGYCSFGDLLRRDQVDAIVAHFRSRPCFNAHVQGSSDGVPRRVGEGAEAFHYGSYALKDIVEAPALIELANDPNLLTVAERYLGCTPTLYSLNAWWSFPGHAKPARVSQSFHRDLDDFRFCTLFVYLTDVDEHNGPHVYVRRTHRPDLLEQELARAGSQALESLEPTIRDAVASGRILRGQGYGIDPAILGPLRHLIDVIPGPAGSGLLADTYGFHMGIPPAKAPRLIFWARYGLHANETSPPIDETLVASRIPWTERARYINRALVTR